MKMNVTFAEMNQSLTPKFGELYAISGGVDEDTIIKIVQKYMEEHPPAPGKDGRDGEDGYTPIKGVDYYTDADKAEMVTAVIGALPVYAGEVSDA